MAIRNVRVSSSLSLSELLEVANDRGLLDWEHQAAQNATMGDIDREKVKVYLELRSASSRQASRFEHMEWGAQLRQVMVPFPQMQACCSLATILKSIFCKVILRVLFRETVGASRYADRRIVTGILQELIDGAELFLSRSLWWERALKGSARRCERLPRTQDFAPESSPTSAATCTCIRLPIMWQTARRS